MLDTALRLDVLADWATRVARAPVAVDLVNVPMPQLLGRGDPYSQPSAYVRFAVQDAGEVRITARRIVSPPSADGLMEAIAIAAAPALAQHAQRLASAQRGGHA